MLRVKTLLLVLALAFLVTLSLNATTAFAEMIEKPVVRLQSLDKVTARTMTFEVKVGSTVKFGPIYIKVQACRKAPPIDQPESASFLQIWEITPRGESKWIYSGWMFASSPALSAMDHPIYDVWVLDCLDRKSSDPVPEKKPDAAALANPDAANQDVNNQDGEVTGAAAEPPQGAPVGSDESAEPGPQVELPTVTFPGESDE